MEKQEGFYNKNLWQSVNAALEGVVHTLKKERNMRLHFVMGFIVLVTAILLDFTYVEIALVLFSITFVLAAEMFNTAIEHFADMVVKEEFHPQIKLVKDIAAGAVFVAAVNAALVGYMLVVHKVDISGGELLFEVRQSPWHITLTAMLVCIGLVLLIKIMRKEKHLLRGGMPSGHSAAAFAVWVIVSLVTLNAMVSILVFMLAFLVARSRMTGGVHSIWEIIAGAVLGSLSALLVYQLLEAL